MEMMLSSKLAEKEAGTKLFARATLEHKRNKHKIFMNILEKRGRLPLTEVAFPLSTNH
jgi:hypothetical protein